MENKIITITDEDGLEKQFRFLFSSLNENTNEEFCFFIEINTPRPMIGAYKLAGENELVNIETKEDIDYVQKAFSEFMAKRKGHCGCGGGCHHHDEQCDCSHDHSNENCQCNEKHCH